MYKKPEAWPIWLIFPICLVWDSQVTFRSPFIFCHSSLSHSQHLQKQEWAVFTFLHLPSIIVLCVQLVNFSRYFLYICCTKEGWPPPPTKKAQTKLLETKWNWVSKCNSNHHSSLSSLFSANWHTMSKDIHLISAALFRCLGEDLVVAFVAVYNEQNADCGNAFPL